MNSPLQDRTILITRRRAQTSEFRKLLEDSGARVLEVPTIEIRPRYEPELDTAIEQLSGYNWLMFTSANGVEIFFDRARTLGKLPPCGAEEPQPKICAIGPATAKKVEDFRYSVDLLPDVYQAEGVLDDFLRLVGDDISVLKILLPRASEAREILPQTLREKGAAVDVIPVYDTVVPEESRSILEQLLKNESPDLVTFTSSSTVRNFVSLAEKSEDLKRLRCAVIGPITAATAREHGLEIVLQAEKSSIPDFVEAIGKYFKQR